MPAEFRMKRRNRSNSLWLRVGVSSAVKGAPPWSAALFRGELLLGGRLGHGAQLGDGEGPVHVEQDGELLIDGDHP